MDPKKVIQKMLQEHTKADIQLEIPKNQDLGDFAFPCFVLSKELKKNPNEIAEDLCKKLVPKKPIRKIEVNGPYLNFYLDEGSIAKDILANIDKDYGKGVIGKGKKLIVEHTSINPNASPHVGRARNALIGDSLVRILNNQNFKVETHYLVNNVGKQIAMLVLGAKGKKVTFKDLLKTYIDFNAKMEKDPEVEKEVFQLLEKLESGEKATIKEFKEIVDICINGQAEIFNDLGIQYDVYDYESDFLLNKVTDNILKKLDKTGKLFTDEDGRKVLDQEEFNLAMKSPVLVLTRSNGNSLYALRDLAYHVQIKKERSIIVLGEDHKLYYEQTKAALSKLKHIAPDPVFYSFILLKDEGKMSTRKGTVVLLEDFMSQAVDKASKEIKKRHGKVDKESAKKIAYGALKYAILKVSPEKNVTFDWEQALNFEGDSGPYLQYAYARIMSILDKEKPKQPKLELLTHEEEAKLIKALGNFPQIAKDAAEQHRPHLIATYAYNLASQFSSFYNNCPVLKADPDLKNARLALCQKTSIVLNNALYLLGIEVLEQM